jgi:CopG family nickel-responsive transcriptional regulator
MERITMSLDETLAADFDRLIKARGYTSRSEAMRELLRREIEADRQAHDTKGFAVAALSYVYNHHERDLAERLTALQHRHHDLVVATMHVHLDHDHCLETVMLKGRAASLRSLADRTKAERGVRHSQLNVVSVATGDAHRLPGAHHHHGHLHLIPR